ncbi:MAG: hypothetical protein QXF85_02550 [Candidatus Micrarchaeaceae archaeon]
MAPVFNKDCLESLLKNADDASITMDDVKALIDWDAKNPLDRDILFKVSRILMQDFTGVPSRGGSCCNAPVHG